MMDALLELCRFGKFIKMLWVLWTIFHFFIGVVCFNFQLGSQVLEDVKFEGAKIRGLQRFFGHQSVRCCYMAYLLKDPNLIWASWKEEEPVLIVLDGFRGLRCTGAKLQGCKVEGSRIATFERFDGTCGMRNLTVIFKYQGMRSDGKKIWMNCSSTVKEDIVNDPTLVIHLERCKNRENLDTCEHFHDIKKENSCVLFDRHNPLWGPFFTSFEPEFKCPVKKAVYRATDGVLDVSAFLLFPQDAWFWKVRAELLEPQTNRILMCIIAEAHIASKH